MSKPDEANAEKRPIVISQGEPSGIGPEIAVKAFVALGGAVYGRPLRLIGGGGVFAAAARDSGIAESVISGAVIETGH